MVLRQFGCLERCKISSLQDASTIGRQIWDKKILDEFPWPEAFQTPLKFTCLQGIMKIYAEYDHSLFPKWTMKYREEKKLPLEGRFMKEDIFVLAVLNRYKTFTNVPWIALSKSFLKCLDTENIRDPLHPLAKKGYRTVFKGDSHRPRDERATSLTDTHEFTLALANMLNTDKELRGTLLRCSRDEFGKLPASMRS